MTARHPTIEECEAAGRGPDNYPGKQYDSGGLPDTPEERERFEAYMRGHCWAVGTYDEKQRSYDTTFVRCCYGVWRDRGALPTTYGVLASEPERDHCTDPDNCKRCKAPTWDQLNHDHAGIPVGPQRNAGAGAHPTCACGDVEREGWEHQPSHCWPYDERTPGLPASHGGEGMTNG